MCIRDRISTISLPSNPSFDFSTVMITAYHFPFLCRSTALSGSLLHKYLSLIHISLSAKIIPFHHPVGITWEPVSAGTGNYLEDSVKETYDVGHLAPEQTDFGEMCIRDSSTAVSDFIRGPPFLAPALCW